MKCDKCGTALKEGDDHRHNDKILCEDCYMDALSPAKFCDPWATYSAESFARNNPEGALTVNQLIILEALKKTGGTDALGLMAELAGRISPEDGERECAALHRMGKISIQNKDGGAFISLK